MVDGGVRMAAHIMDDIRMTFTRFHNVDPVANEGCLADLTDVEPTVASGPDEVITFITEDDDVEPVYDFSYDYD